LAQSTRSKSAPGSPTKQGKGGHSRRQSAGPDPVNYRAILLGVVLVIATVVLYYPVGSHPFTNFDDDVYVTGNAHVKAGLHWSTVQWAFSTFDACNWHPLTWLSHSTDCQFFGLDPAGHHDVNLLLHVLNVLLLLGILVRATGAVGPSLAVAALFAVHPINVESVAWVAERKNLLSLLLFLLALGAYDWYARQPRIGRYAAMMLLYACALMAKPQVITFPFVLLLWDYWPLRRTPGQDEAVSRATGIPQRPWTWLVLEKFPLLALSAVSAVITVKAQRAFGAIRWFPFSLRAKNAIVAYALYVKKAVWPSRLALIYPHPEHSIPTWQVLLSLIFLLAATAAVVSQARRRRYLFVGWFWFLGTLVPMIGLVQVGGQAMADRYAYLSFIGLFIMVCWGVREWAATRHIPSRSLAWATVAVLVALAAVTHHQLDYWADNVGLWTHTLQITSDNWLAENNMGAALLGERRPEDAIEHFRRSAAIYPDDPVSHLDIGYYEQGHGNLDAAMAEYRKVVAITPKEKAVIAAEAENNTGYGYLKLRDLANAKTAFQAAVNFNPQHGRAWIGLGVVAQKSGDVDGAIQDYSRSVEADPTDLGYLLLAQALTVRGETAKAAKATNQARLISPDFEHAQRLAQGFVGN